jgi:hypothetical protein
MKHIHVIVKKPLKDIFYYNIQYNLNIAHANFEMLYIATA